MPAAELAALLAARQPCVVLTGAGVSTDSGIPDFRSSTGVWAEVDPLEVASIEAFRRDPERVWAFYRRRIQMLLDRSRTTPTSLWPSSSDGASSGRS